MWVKFQCHCFLILVGLPKTIEGHCMSHNERYSSSSYLPTFEISSEIRKCGREPIIDTMKGQLLFWHLHYRLNQNILGNSYQFFHHNFYFKVRTCYTSWFVNKKKVLLEKYLYKLGTFRLGFRQEDYLYYKIQEYIRCKTFKIFEKQLAPHENVLK